jgi:membrane protein required for colicin V production
MSPYDILMLVVLVGTTVLGAWKGMAWQLASLASLIVSYFVALQFSPQLAPMFGDQAPWNRFIAMLVIYIATSMIVWLIFRAVAQMIDRVKLKEFDRQLGALFGLAKGVLLCVAITFFAVTLLSDDQKETVLTSHSGYYIGLLITQAHAVMPDEIHDVVHPYLHRIQEELDGENHPPTGPGHSLVQPAPVPGSEATTSNSDPGSEGEPDPPGERTAERLRWDRADQ